MEKLLLHQLLNLKFLRDESQMLTKSLHNLPINMNLKQLINFTFSFLEFILSLYN